MSETAVTVDGATIAFERTGQGPSLILVHGLGDDRSVWYPLVALLSPHFTCVLLDLRGHGSSGSASDYDVFGLARDVTAVAALLDEPRPVLIGHSLGGFVVTMAATQVATRGVVNLDQPLSLSQFGRVVRALEHRLETEGVGAVLWELLELMGLGELSAQRCSQLKAHRARLAVEVVRGAWAPLLANDDEAVSSLVDGYLRRVHQPYLSVHGTALPEGYTEWLRARIEHGQLIQLPSAGHFPHLSSTDELGALLLSWLRALA